MENYNINEVIEKEKLEHSEVEIFEEIHDDTKFLMKGVLKLVVDDWGSDGNTVEASHYDTLNYKVINYNSPNFSEVLDLTWMNKNDSFDFDRGQYHEFIKQINVNIDNLGTSHLPIGEKNAFKDFKLVVHCNNSSLSPIYQIKNFKTFVESLANGNWRDPINKIELEGFNPTINMVLSHYAKKCGIRVIIQDNQSKMRK